MVPVGSDQRWVQFGPYCADLRARELTKHGIRLKLQSRPFEILVLLLERPGDVVTREDIRAKLWPNGTFVDFDSNISSAMRKLRDSLCDSAAEPRYIETVGRVGYRFIARVEFATENGGSALTHAAMTAEPLPQVAEIPRPDDAALNQRPATSEEMVTGAGRMVTTASKLGRKSDWLHSSPFVFICIVCLGLAILLVSFSRNRLADVASVKRGAKPSSQPMRDASAEYALGRELWARRGEDPLKAAIEHFNRAIEKQPNFGLAYSGLADSYVLLPFYSRVSAAEAYPVAKAAALKAIALAPQTAEAHTSLAYVKVYGDWDFRGAEQEFQAALKRDPNYPTALQWHAEYLSLIGRFDEAVNEINRALQLMPNSPVMHHNAGQIYQAARQFDKAIEEYQIALSLDPKFGSARVFMALAYMRKGLYDKAMEIQMQQATEAGDPTRIALLQKLNNSYRAKGFEGYLRELVAVELEENPDRDFYRIAHCYAMLGEKDLAFQYLERSFQAHNADILSLNVDPELDSLRSDPRFLALRRRVGLPVKVLEFF